MKEAISPLDYTGDILKALPGGVLLTAKAGGQVNPMTIGWGAMGVEWGKPIFIAFVREGRHTRLLLDKNPEFTVNIPLESTDKKILGFCGSQSGRDVDKITALGLHLEDPDVISVPGVRELPLTLECRVIYRQVQDLHAVPQDLRERYYPQGVSGSAAGASSDIHIAYYGEIVAAYILR